MTWGQFLKAHWNVLAAADFFTVEVWGPRGLVTFYVFFVIELATRRIEIVGITPGPNERWMVQVGRNLTDPIEGFLAEKKLLILDRDSKYSPAFQGLLKDVGIGVVGVAIPASFAYLENPEVFVPLVATLGPLGLIAAPVLAFAVKYGKDAWKHRDH